MKGKVRRSGSVGAIGSGRVQFLEHAASHYGGKGAGSVPKPALEYDVLTKDKMPKRRRKRNGLKGKADRRALRRFFVIVVAFTLSRETLKQGAHDGKAYSWDVGEPTPIEAQQSIKDALRTARAPMADKTGMRLLKLLFGCLNWSGSRMTLLGIMPQAHHDFTRQLAAGSTLNETIHGVESGRIGTHSCGLHHICIRRSNMCHGLPPSHKTLLEYPKHC